MNAYSFFPRIGTFPITVHRPIMSPRQGEKTHGQQGDDKNTYKHESEKITALKGLLHLRPLVTRLYDASYQSVRKFAHHSGPVLQSSSGNRGNFNAAQRHSRHLRAILTAMNRTVIAFIAAPLWVPVAVGVVAYTLESGHDLSVAVDMLYNAFVAYLGAFALGLPTFLFLRSRKMTTFWIATLSGCIIGGVWGVMFTTGLIFYFGGIGAIQKLVGGNGNLVQMSLSPTLLGMIVGATVWLIVRPDRGHSVT